MLIEEKRTFSTVQPASLSLAHVREVCCQGLLTECRMTNGLKLMQLLCCVIENNTCWVQVNLFCRRGALPQCVLTLN